ncbi:hypothetical protein E2P81_ATG00995 [Venturia nashicola]|uniref:Uncharacterized protein n=1 Tax=Venturia nashicola TaxID=86259 RepID=A0A4Z1PQV9_9PEZI|nr:hypothetical protein E6O75_ATG01018 [Venturia nashicola]TLD38452.1 hypothetical protein E2P81_ATG00995 [Venturia nashicola]
MKSSIATLLSLVATSAAQIFCIQAITTTVPYLPALTLAANNSCPTASSAKYYSVDGAAGCCSDAATAVTLQSTAGLACCPCAAQCTGYMPKIQAWTLIDDKLQITGPASLTAMATSAPTAITTGQYRPSLKFSYLNERV